MLFWYPLIDIEEEVSGHMEAEADQEAEQDDDHHVASLPRG
jgi:hypothetical protein